MPRAELGARPRTHRSSRSPPRKRLVLVSSRLTRGSCAWVALGRGAVPQVRRAPLCAYWRDGAGLGRARLDPSVGLGIALDARMAKYRDRRQAGQVLAKHLGEYARRTATCVVALPRGGVPVAYEVARALNLPLDVFIVRKLGIPGHEELAMGAIAAGPAILAKQLINWDTVRAWGVTNTSLNRIIAQEQAELMRRESLYRGSQQGLSLTGKTVILVDDGLATGTTMRVAVLALREYHPARIVVAVPVGDPNTCLEMSQVADESVCAVTPSPLRAVSDWYDDFDQTTDGEVQRLLAMAAREYSAVPSPARPHALAG